MLNKIHNKSSIEEEEEEEEETVEDGKEHANNNSQGARKQITRKTEIRREIKGGEKREKRDRRVRDRLR